MLYITLPLWHTGRQVHEFSLCHKATTVRLAAAARGATGTHRRSKYSWAFGALYTRVSGFVSQMYESRNNLDASCIRAAHKHGSGLLTEQYVHYKATQ